MKNNQVQKIIIIVIAIVLIIISIILLNNNTKINNFKIFNFNKLTDENQNTYILEYEKINNVDKYVVQIFDKENKKIQEEETPNNLIIFENDNIKNEEEYKIKVCAHIGNKTKCKEKNINKIENLKNNDFACLNYVNNNTYDEKIANTIVEKSKEYLGIPFIFGSPIKNENAKNPKEKYLGLDCADFVQSVMETVFNEPFGDSPFNLAYQLRNKCVLLSDLKPGDILFWEDYNSKSKDIYNGYNRMAHVGIYIENGRVIEATRNADWGYQGIVYSDLFRDRGNYTFVMIARPYA